jgi:hypothetical protein
MNQDIKVSEKLVEKIQKKKLKLIELNTFIEVSLVQFKIQRFT